MTDPRHSVLYIPAGRGRRYDMGGMHAEFLADSEETADTYSISEWWLEPGQPGPGAHSHEANDDIFYVIEGTMTFLAGDETIHAEKGAFLRIPPGVVHDFSNTSEACAGVLNIYIPGGFEPDMPAIVDWFRSQK